MKKIVIMVLAFTSLNITAFGQEDSRENLRLGAKVGINRANIYDSQGENFSADPKNGLAFGAFLSVPLGKYVGVQPEVMYSQKGFEGSGTIFGNEYQLKRTSTYLDVPLLIALKPSKRLTLLAGPQYSYLMSQKDEYNSPGIDIDYEQEFDNDNIRKNMLGAALGVDINFANMVIGARASWDLTKNNGDGTSSEPRYKNALIQGTIGFVF